MVREYSFKEWLTTSLATGWLETRESHCKFRTYNNIPLKAYKSAYNELESLSGRLHKVV